MKKFSLLMPTKDRQKFIGEAIQAIMNQTYPNWELIIGDGSDSITPLNFHDEKIIHFHEPKMGITRALNQAIGYSSGDVFMWCNDDDLLMSDALETISQFESYWGYGQMDDGEVRGYECTLEDLKKGNCICQPTVWWTKEVMTKVGVFNESIDLVSDYDYWVRLMKFCPGHFIPKVLSKYRIHPDQITQKNPQGQMSQANIVRGSI